MQKSDLADFISPEFT